MDEESCAWCPNPQTPGGTVGIWCPPWGEVRYTTCGELVLLPHSPLRHPYQDGTRDLTQGLAG